jgi:hypothetical protein
MDAHSKAGLMKKLWSGADYADMLFQPLRLNAEDIQRIRMGLAARSMRATADAQR